MDRRDSRGGGEYGPSGGGGGRAGGNRSYDRSNQPQQGDGGRWQNDMYDSSAQQPRGNHGGGGGGYRERGGQHQRRTTARDIQTFRVRDLLSNMGDQNQDNDYNNNFAGQSGEQNWPTPAGAAGDGGGDAKEGEGKACDCVLVHLTSDEMSSSVAFDNGHFDHRPEISGEREQGRVCSLKESFGFVRCMDRPGDLFFHLTEAPANINVGDEVDFFIGMGNRSGKDCAMKLNLLPPGTVSSEVVLDASFLGVIERDIRSYPSSMPSTHRANMMGRSRPQESQQTEGLIKITGAAPPDETVAADEIAVAQEGEDHPADGTEGGDGGEDTQVSPETETTFAGGDVADAAPETEDANAAQVVRPVLPANHKGVTAAPLGLQGAMVSYLVTDAVEENAGSKFRRGDEVRFKVSQEKGSGRKRAVEVVLVRTNREKREEDQLKKLVDSGATKQQGVVKKLTHDYGFLQSLSSSDVVYFNTAHVVQTGQGERLRVGSQAEFWVVPDRTKDRRESFRALEIKLLPPGTIKLEEETHQKVRGTVQRAPTLPQRQSFGGGREGTLGRGGGGGMQPGVARFTIPAPSVEASPEGEEKAEDAVARMTSMVASLNHKELGKSQVPTLEVGDVIEADLWKSKLGGGTTQAKNVKLVSFGGERVEGVVKSLRDGGFGFIRPLGGTEDVYFRINDTCKNLPDLREGSEVIFTQHESERGGEKKRATRVEVYPKGTLKLEVSVASGVSGVVTRDAKGSGQGAITITDGNNLDLPAELRFPKIAAQVRDFADSDDKELVFSDGLSAGERNAAHTLAAKQGLGHESRGEEGKRALLVWKPQNEDEAVAIKEAEEKRTQERSSAAKERSKNGERSLTVPFTREDTAPAKTEDKSQDPGKASNASQDVAGEGAEGNTAPPKASKSKLTQDFRTEKGFAGFGAAVQRGDLVTFDVVLNRGNMKRRAANVKVTKRAAPQTSNANSKGIGNSATAGGGEENGSTQDQEFMGVVSLVQVERHYGFIEVLDMDERVFFHLSEVLPDNNGASGSGNGGTAEDSGRVGVSEKALETESNPNTADSTSTTNTTNNNNTNTTNKPTIRRGQEVAFRIGQRQGKPLGLRVRKLRPGTLPTEESLPCRFVGVVVVPPRNVATTDKEKDAMTSAAGMEGTLVMLQEKSATASELSAPPLADGTGQQQEGETAQESSAREAENEASKAQRMLSLAGIRVAPLPQDAGISASNSVAKQPPSATSSLLLNPNGVYPAKRRSRGGGGAAPKGPPRFSVLRFLASTGGEGVPQAATAAAPGDAPAVGQEGEGGTAISYGRGDLVEFTVVARRGQRQQSQRVGDVSLLRKAGLPCRRGKVLQVDAKAGVAHVKLLDQDEDQARLPPPTPPVAGKEVKETEVDAITAAAASASTTSSAVDGKEAEPHAPSSSSSTVGSAGSSRIFFLLKEMVGAAGPLRNGDEVEFMLPTPLPEVSSQKPVKTGNLAGGGHAVGAVRVQARIDLKSLSGARQRLNINLRDSQKGPQVRMAQGPGGAGFKPGHRASTSLYASVTPTEATLNNDTVALEESNTAMASGDVANHTNLTATEVDATIAETANKDEQKASVS
ncbi:unnamed protein product [Scytosiphon promiscuus]